MDVNVRVIYGGESLHIILCESFDLWWEMFEICLLLESWDYKKYFIKYHTKFANVHNFIEQIYWTNKNFKNFKLNI